jgi:hypothetical protein
LRGEQHKAYFVFRNLKRFVFEVTYNQIHLIGVVLFTLVYERSPSAGPSVCLSLEPETATANESLALVLVLGLYIDGAPPVDRSMHSVSTARIFPEIWNPPQEPKITREATQSANHDLQTQSLEKIKRSRLIMPAY